MPGLGAQMRFWCYSVVELLHYGCFVATTSAGLSIAFCISLTSDQMSLSPTSVVLSVYWAMHNQKKKVEVDSQPLL